MDLFCPKGEGAYRYNAYKKKFSIQNFIQYKTQNNILYRIQNRVKSEIAIKLYGYCVHCPPMPLLYYTQHTYLYVICLRAIHIVPEKLCIFDSLSFVQRSKIISHIRCQKNSLNWHRTNDIVDIVPTYCVVILVTQVSDSGHSQTIPLYKSQFYST